MKHFQFVGRVDPFPLLHAITLRPELWNQDTLRTEHEGTAHAEVDDIWLWFNRTDEPKPVVDDKDCIPYPAWEKLSAARTLVFDLMRRVEGVRLGRVIITRLPAGKRIARHVDGGAPADYYSRYQIALQSLPGCLFSAGDETITFDAGDVWYFDNKQEHEVVNNSADDRIVMIVDIRPA